MLSELYIENIALIKKSSVSFGMGLNVLTGETGAGKTILISAIQAVLGERISRELIRTGEKKAVVTALFCNLSLGTVQYLTELGFSPDEEGNLLILREITASGNNCKINGMPATVAALRQIGGRLLVIHGQNDTGALSDTESHRRFVDDFGRLGEELLSYSEIYSRLVHTREKLAAAGMSEAQKAQRMDFLTFQIGELTSHGLIPGEEEVLTARREVIRNAERIALGLSGAVMLLDGDETQGAADAAIEAAGQISKISRFLPAGEELAERLSTAGYELKDICDTLREQMSDTEYDPDELDDIESRLDTLGRLSRKYGGDSAEMLSRIELLQKELDEILFSEEYIKKLEEEEGMLRKAALKAAGKLTEKRKEAGERFSRMVERELADLDMPAVRLAVSIEPKELGPLGADSVEILFSANRGEEMRPLSKIASGGEMSRVMLSIKSVMSGKDDIDTLIFDEIDTGVSGRAAHKIGTKLGQASRDRQILCVTHLAQVAAFADRHLLIEKQTDDQSTFTKVISLSDDGRIRELARITGGETITDASLDNAREMLLGARATNSS